MGERSAARVGAETGKRLRAAVNHLAAKSRIKKVVGLLVMLSLHVQKFGVTWPASRWGIVNTWTLLLTVIPRTTLGL